QAAIFCAGALAILLWRARTEPAPWRLVLAVLTGWALALGLLDAATWHGVPGARFGGLFHSVLVYVRFNLVENRGAQWGVERWTFYGRVLWSSMPVVTALCAVGLVASIRKAPGLATMVLVFLGFHAWVAHKEYRFLMPVLPVWCAAAGVGMAQLSRIPFFRLLVPAMVLAGLASTLGARSLTMGDLGAYLDRPMSSAWNDFGNVNRLLVAASKRNDVCGMRIDVAHLAWTGGSTYLHHKAPLYMGNTPASTRFFNYAIVRPGSGAEVIASDNGLELVRLPIQCVPDEHYSWRLP
ncbi:MAG: hypothetical protein JNG84_13710, partial [Archangium sp.]|nr:hypothetical protein [Archangium sp.]